MKEQIGGILIYENLGHNRPCGQLMGANGAGTFGVVFYGSPEAAYKDSKTYIEDLRGQGYRIKSVMFVPNEATAFGDQISFIDTGENNEIK